MESHEGIWFGHVCPLPAMESHEGIWFGHVCPHHFMVFAMLKVLVPGLFTVASSEAVQAEVLSVSVAAIATPK